MKRNGDQFVGPAKERSGWLIPLAVFAVTAALSALVLLYYFAPASSQFAAQRPAPTDSPELVLLSLGSTEFHVPSNYILFPNERSGGEMEELSLIALLPDMQGYTLREAQAFNSNAADSRVVHMVVRRERIALSGEDRLARVYRPILASTEGTETEFGVTRYTFRADSGYRDEELYVGESESGPSLIRCTRPDEAVPSPSCIGDIPLENGLVLTYRFKRAHIGMWRDIAAGARALVGAFMVHS